MKILHQIAGLALVGGVAFLGAQDPAKPQEQQDFKLSTQAELVLLDVGVKDPNGGYISNLTKDNFRVFEDGKLQTISSFGHDDLPVTVGLVIDHSGSMQRKIPDVVNAGLGFIRESNPGDEIFVVQFNDNVRASLPVDVPFTSDVVMLRDALMNGPVRGRTALYDGIVFALQHLASGKQDKKALLLVSDGGDNASMHQFKDVMTAVRDSPATIYAVGIFDEDDPDRNPALLQRLAKATGGEAFFPRETSGVIDLCRQIAKDIRSRYSIGYVPVRKDDKGSLRSIRVEVTGPAGRRLVVHARTSYFLPAR